MAYGYWIIRLQEEDHLEQSLHKVDDLDHSLHDAGSSDFRKGMIWITHFMNQRNCFAVMNHQLCEAKSSIFTKQPKNEVISQYELAVGQEGVHPVWPLVREGEHFLNNSKDGKMMYLALPCRRLSKVSLLSPLGEGKNGGV